MELSSAGDATVEATYSSMLAMVVGSWEDGHVMRVPKELFTYDAGE